jgi:hypothetical protein
MHHLPPFSLHRIILRISVYTLAVNMGTSVHMIEKHYGHLKPLQAHRELTARYKI